MGNFGEFLKIVSNTYCGTDSSGLRKIIDPSVSFQIAKAVDFVVESGTDWISELDPELRAALVVCGFDFLFDIVFGFFGSHAYGIAKDHSVYGVTDDPERTEPA